MTFSLLFLQITPPPSSVCGLPTPTPKSTDRNVDDCESVRLGLLPSALEACGVPRPNPPVPQPATLPPFLQVVSASLATHPPFPTSNPVSRPHTLKGSLYCTLSFPHSSRFLWCLLSPGLLASSTSIRIRQSLLSSPHTHLRPASSPKSRALRQSRIRLPPLTTHHPPTPQGS